jgi:VIT1/CCC1 family predicted Fe2+/Mn2+ transporter
MMTDQSVAVVVDGPHVAAENVDGQVISTPAGSDDLKIKVVSSLAAVLVRMGRTFLQVFLATVIGGTTGAFIPVVSDALPPSDMIEHVMAAVYVAALAALISGAQRAYEIMSRIDDKYPTWTA